MDNETADRPRRTASIVEKLKSLSDTIYSDEDLNADAADAVTVRMVIAKEIVNAAERANELLSEMERELEDAHHWRALAGCNSFQEMHTVIGEQITRAARAEYDRNAAIRLERARDKREELRLNAVLNHGFEIVCKIPGGIRVVEDRSDIDDVIEAYANAPDGRTCLEMDNAEYDRMRDALGPDWEWQGDVSVRWGKDCGETT